MTAVETFTLTGDLGTLVVGDTIQRRLLRARLESNTNGQPIVDTNTDGQLHFGTVPLKLDADGKFVQPGIISSNAEGTNIVEGTLQYQVVVDYDDPTIGKSLPPWESGFFAMTADADLRAKADSALEVPIEWRSIFEADMETIKSDTEDARDAAAGSATDAADSASTATTKAGIATAKAGEASGSADDASASSAEAAGYAGVASGAAASTDSVMAGRIADDASLTAAALSASYAPIWKTGTVYTVGQVIQAPDGGIVKVATAHTAGGSYDVTKFTAADGPTAVTDARIDGRVVKLASGYAGANDRAKIQAAVDAAAASGTNIVRLDRRPLTTVWEHDGTPVTFPSGVTIEAEEGVTVYVTANISGSQVGFFTAAGTEGTKTALTSDVAAGASSVTLPTGAGASYASGDLIAIEANTAGIYGTNGRPREIQRVFEVAGDVVSFGSPLLDSYAVADSATFSKITPVRNVNFRNIHFTNADPLTNKGVAIWVTFGDHVQISDVLLTDAGGGIFFNECVSSKIDRVEVDRLRNFGDSLTPYGYGVLLQGACNSIEINNLTGNSTRHLFTTIGVLRNTTEFWGAPKHVSVNDSSGTGCRDSYSIFDTHEAGNDITFNNCRAVGGGILANGFQQRAKNVRQVNCISLRAGLRASTSTLNAVGLRIIGGQYTRAATNGLSLQANDTQVIGAEVSKNGTGGVIAATAGMTDLIVKGCTIKENGQTLASQYAIGDLGAIGAVYDGNTMPKSTTQLTSIQALQATSVAVNNICLGYGANSYGFVSANASAIRRNNTGDSGTEFSGDVVVAGFLRHNGTQLGVLGTNPVTKRTVSGSRTGETAADTSLRAAMAAFGFITDSTTP